MTGLIVFCHSVDDLRAVSFQDLPLTYSFVSMDEASQGVFSLNQDGRLTLNEKLVSVSDLPQYRMVIRADEDVTARSTEVQVQLN